MSKESVISALAKQFEVSPTHLGGKLAVTGDPNMYNVRSGSVDVASLFFDNDGKLKIANKRLTPDTKFYNEGEIGRVLVELIASLASATGENSACSLGTYSIPPSSVESQNQPRRELRSATVACGQIGRAHV